MMLPHGFEGQGPEHSSARLERFLQLCAEYNIQVCVPTTSAQMFHLLRRQMMRPYRKPLIIISPKSMLRLKDSCSGLSEFSQAGFQPIINEIEKLNANTVMRIVACCGKVYYGLVEARNSRNIHDVAIIRIEQLYPFPHDEFSAQLKLYGNAKEVVWVQEEPANQGAWHRIQHYLLRHMKPQQILGYALRLSSASPAVGYGSLHNTQQAALISAAFDKIGDNFVAMTEHARPVQAIKACSKKR